MDVLPDKGKNLNEQLGQIWHEKKPIIIISAVVILLVVVFGTYIIFSQQIGPDKQSRTVLPTTLPVQISPIAQTTVDVSPDSVIYAKSEEDGTIQLFSGNSEQSALLATLSGKLRSLEPLPGKRVVYVADLGFLDRGEKIEVFDTSFGKVIQTIPASSGFAIENFRIVGEGKGIVFWEVEKAKVTTGTSHVVYQSLTDPAERKILVDEPLGDATKYPVLALNKTDQILLDSYSVERKGIHQGLFSISLSGQGGVEELLPVDSYSSIPAVSPDGTTLVYTAYNPSAPLQLPTPPVPNGLFRAAIRNPNQIKIYNLVDKSVKVLLDGKSGELFYNPKFTKDGKAVVFKQAAIENDTVQPLTIKKVDLATNSVSMLINRSDVDVLGEVGSRFLVGFGTGTLANIGGLDSSYSPSYTSTYLFDIEDNSFEKVLSDDEISVIGIE